MRNSNQIKFYITAFLVFSCLISTRIADAQSGQCTIPTITASVQYPPGWFPEFQWDPNNPQSINRNDSVSLSVIGGTEPYTWSVIGTGFYFEEDQTSEPLNTLIADGTSCGAAMVTVTDSEGLKVSGSLRQPNNGRWVLIHEESCGEVVHRPGEGNCSNCSIVVVGIYRFQDCWWGGTNSYSRYDGPYCEKWPFTADLSETKCSDPGFYFPFPVVGLTDHNMWEWRCN